MPMNFTPFLLYRVTLRATPNKRDNEQVIPLYDIAVIGQQGQADAGEPITDDEQAGVRSTLDRHFRNLAPDSLKIERDRYFTAYQPDGTEHFVCVASNGFFFMRDNRVDVGSPLEIFGENSQLARDIAEVACTYKRRQ